MKRPEAPCIFCCARKLGCHANCDQYKKYQKEQKEYREYITAQKVEENKLEEIEVKRFRK